ncbi:hypothetical protein EIM92_18830 [Paenibacillus lentus]|uniref:Uncharacterized protein n=2 Tax=Paenibacillus lentus TaxID=1338368 RepID=A0A3Q8SD62_9BACL|nr:hypothetical protein EIM92_18830 [Paenibacillus lentus]
MSWQMENRWDEGESDVNKGDIIIYACVIIGAGIGLIFHQAFPGVLVGLGVGYLIKQALYKDKEE